MAVGVMALVVMAGCVACRDDARHLHAQGNLFSAQGAKSAAIVAFKGAALNGGKSPDHWLSLGHALFRGHRFHEAEAAYSKALEVSRRPANVAMAKLALAKTLVQKGRSDDAARLLAGVIADSGCTRETRTSAIVALALLHSDRGLDANAQALLDRLQGAKDKIPAALYQSGRIALGAGNAAHARVCFARLEEKWPARPYAAYGFALLASLEGLPAKACEHLEKARDRGLQEGRAVLNDRAFGPSGPPPCANRLWGHP